MASRGDYLLLVLAVLAISAAAPLIRYAAAPTLAIAMWRNTMAVPLLAGPALRRRRPDADERRLIALSGLFLAAHFGTWVPSISYTSVASSVALVATQPVWAALIARWRGEPVHREVWIGIGVALCGVLILTGVDLSISRRALFGDLLAVAGGMLAAAYVTVGSQVRRTVDTTVYAAGAYLVAGATLTVVCVVAGRPLWGYPTATWLALGGLVLGPQLLGHTLINRVLRSISATAVSVSILFEVVGASVIAALWFGETPPLAAAPAGLLILSGIIIVIRSGRRRAAEGVPRG